MNKLVSVIVPVYNVERYVEKCLMSILEQSYRDIEVLVVDDGSTDRSPEICKKISDRDSRIVFLKKSNGGQGSARNLALDKANGFYIMFVDSDDSIDKDCIDFLVNELEEKNLDVACCNSVSYDETGKFVSYRTKGPKDCVLTGLETIRSLWYGEYINIAPWAKLFTANLWDKNRFEECYGEDFATMHKIYLQANRVGYSNVSKLNYLIRTNSDIHSFKDKKIELLTVADKNLEFAKSHPELDLYSAALSKTISVYLHVFFQLPEEKKYSELKKKIKQFVVNNRRPVLKDGRTRKKTKYGLLMTYVGFSTTKRMLHILHRVNAAY